MSRYRHVRSAPIVVLVNAPTLRAALCVSTLPSGRLLDGFLPLQRRANASALPPIACDCNVKRSAAFPLDTEMVSSAPVFGARVCMKIAHYHRCFSRQHSRGEFRSESSMKLASQLFTEVLLFSQCCKSCCSETLEQGATLSGGTGFCRHLRCEASIHAEVCAQRADCGIPSSHGGPLSNETLFYRRLDGHSCSKTKTAVPQAPHTAIVLYGDTQHMDSSSPSASAHFGATVLYED